jgi:hypothetical protein
MAKSHGMGGHTGHEEHGKHFRAEHEPKKLHHKDGMHKKGGAFMVTPMHRNMEAAKKI